METSAANLGITHVFNDLLGERVNTEWWEGIRRTLEVFGCLKFVFRLEVFSFLRTYIVTGDFWLLKSCTMTIGVARQLLICGVIDYVTLV